MMRRERPSSSPIQEAPRIDETVGWNMVMCLVNTDDGTRIVVERGFDHGLFRYVVERHFGPAEEDEGLWPLGFWQAVEVSGLFKIVEAAEREARMRPGWTLLRADPITCS